MVNHILNGALFKREKKPTDVDGKTYPVYDLNLEINGVKIRAAAWPAQKSPKGITYLPINGDYGRDEVRRLVDVNPTMLAGGSVSAAAVEAAPAANVNEALPF